MTVAEALRESGLEPIDAELLAAYASQKSRTWIAAHSNDPFDSNALKLFEDYAERRKRGEPVAYILGTKEFFGRPFHVTPATLIPRPSTELLVQVAFDVLNGKPADRLRTIDNQIVAWTELQEDLSDVTTIVDVGTGSGCIAITIACERPDLAVIATDISADALMIAAENVVTHRVSDRITFKHGDALAAAEPLTEPFLIISNPPYIPDDIQLEKDVADFEPSSALFAGKEGTDVLHSLVQAARNHPFCRGFIIECREEQTMI